MSWSIEYTGEAAKIAQRIETDERVQLIEPEHTIRENVYILIIGTLKQFPPDYPVHVRARGTQGTSGDKTLHDLLFTIEPIYGFVR